MLSKAMLFITVLWRENLVCYKSHYLHCRCSVIPVSVEYVCSCSCYIDVIPSPWHTFACNTFSVYIYYILANHCLTESLICHEILFLIAFSF